MKDADATRMILRGMKLTADASNVVIADKGQGISSIDYFSQLDEKYMDNICRVICRHRGSIKGVQQTMVLLC